MFHTRFCGNLPIGSGEDVFLKGFHHIMCKEHGGHLGHMTSILSTNLHFHVPKILLTKYG